ncbi:alpha/beta fold hydrolase [Cronobacter malonaticus]|uniref:Lipoprotein signal peptide n=1 Tax=Cronobacter malonaticus TaxID=413503 RepID=A0ABX5JWG5_9ENTR|nr:alpha/beta fold hydrolase [Cronobacter malonaticus]ALX80234.1 lipoprotein signal peptide [Cronobacter malonaticus LMG 23826]EGT4282148.1 alpha/beta fold hydrolase [Cronobacter malonaticus]EGT4290690.1 alpha/beta fold hydrolase [Cronobacter malonaticus]EGT4299158.1 alpha/beta fold hydrolase [Cronobacter malonaticus]EGT4336453.1 alpha/beta fold hydrolase [Cronobacter malonaticus]
MYRLTTFITTLLLSVAASADVGFHQFTIDSPATRPLDAAVWYPTYDNHAPETVGDNIVFSGVNVQRDATPAPGAHPVLLLSHGFGGNWRNLNWLAHAMAEQGYIVATVDHPGTTTRNKSPAQAQALWQRPKDVMRVLDALIASPEKTGKPDEQRIAAAGHSLGGWTVMELAGARFSAPRFLADCKSHPALGGCIVAHTLGIDLPGTQNRLAESQRDVRIKAVVSLDLGLARGFTPQSLAKVEIPVLVMSAGVDSDDVPAALESGYLAHALPGKFARAISVPGATHFSFMQLCKPGAAAVIDAQEPGEGIVCRDGAGFSREKIHQQLTTQISEFLNQTLRYQPPRGDIPPDSSPQSAKTRD